MNIFVAKLDFSIQEDELREVFESYGDVSSVKIVMDRATGRSKGYGFVEMPVEDEAITAIEGLDGSEIEGGAIVVKKARPKEEGQGNRFNNRGGGGFNNYNRY